MIDEKIKEKIVLALDVETFEQAKELVDELSPYVGTFKVGLQLYTGFGNEIIDYIKSKNSNFFLDVKLMDIPNTVKKASENIVELKSRDGKTNVEVDASSVINKIRMS